MRRFYPNLPKHKLEFLSEYFNFKVKSNHDSLADVYATGELLELLLENRIIPTAKKRSELLAKQKNKFWQVAGIFKNLQAELNDDLNLQSLIVNIVNEFDLKKVYRAKISEEGSKRIEKIRDLYRLANDELTNKSGINAIKELLQYASLSNTDFDALTSNKPKIPIITIHQAKGLEFQYEFLAGMNDDVFPSYFSTKYGSISEEEKRLFYVAITRAKQGLFLSSSGKKSRLLDYIADKFITQNN